MEHVAAALALMSNSSSTDVSNSRSSSTDVSNSSSTDVSNSSSSSTGATAAPFLQPGQFQRVYQAGLKRTCAARDLRAWSVRPRAPPFPPPFGPTRTSCPVECDTVNCTLPATAFRHPARFRCSGHRFPPLIPGATSSSSPINSSSMGSINRRGKQPQDHCDKCSEPRALRLIDFGRPVSSLCRRTTTLKVCDKCFWIMCV